jgi:hypothetical protein
LADHSARAAEAIPVVGLLSSRSPATDAHLIAIIRQGLNETGFAEGQNVAFDYRWTEGHYDRLATSVVLRHHAEGRPLPRREQWARQG